MKSTPATRTAADVTLCIFRRWRSGRKEVLALFPEEPHDPDGFKCTSYQHTGQHGGADYAHCIAATRPASLDEPDVAALRRELESEPYNYRLEVRQKAPPDAYHTRAGAIARQVRHRRETVTDLRTLRALERAGWIREAEPGDWQKGRRYVDPIDEGTRPRHGKYSLAYRDGCLFPYVIRTA